MNTRDYYYTYLLSSTHLQPRLRQVSLDPLALGLGGLGSLDVLQCAWDVVDAALEDTLVEFNRTEVVRQFLLWTDLDMIVLADSIASFPISLGLVVADAWSELAFLQFLCH